MPSHPASPAAPDWVALAAFGPPHGVSGRIKVKSFTDPVDEFASHPTLADESGRAFTLKITGHAQGYAICAVEGITDRNQAELLRGKKIGVARTALPVLEKPNQFYIDDLIGMNVLDLDGNMFGTVKSVANYGAGDILDIHLPDGTSELYSFTSATFPVVDTHARFITIDPPVILGSAQEESPASE